MDIRRFVAVKLQSFIKEDPDNRLSPAQKFAEENFHLWEDEESEVSKEDILLLSDAVEKFGELQKYIGRTLKEIYEFELNK